MNSKAWYNGGGNIPEYSTFRNSSISGGPPGENQVPFLDFSFLGGGQYTPYGPEDLILMGRKKPKIFLFIYF